MMSKIALEGTVSIPEESVPEFQPLIPSMNVSLPQVSQTEENKPEIVSDETLIGIYDEVLVNIRDDRSEIDSVLTKFVDMVVNEGDSSSASKEALVNLLKLKVDQSDKMSKMADLMTRIKMKDRTAPGGPWLNANQTNNINIGDSGQKKALLEALNKAKKGS